jgi:hypothetical protein
MFLNHRGAAFMTAVALAAFFCAPSAFSQSRFEEDFDDVNKPWQEVALQLPAAPSAANLIPLYVSATATQDFALDEKSLSIGPDGVIRYTMVATSPAGAKNISYEGIRCQTFEKKSYAFARADGSWARARRDQWESIVRNAANRQQAVLALDFFCESKSIAGNRDVILQRLRNNQPINTRSDR